MGTVVPIQSSFSAGEISPRLRGRVGTDLYQQALARCRNWQPLAQGSLLMRSGVAHCLKTGLGAVAKARMVDIPIAGQEGYLAVLTDKTLSTYWTQALLDSASIEGPSLDLEGVVNGDFNEEAGGDPASWLAYRTNSTVQFNNGPRACLTLTYGTAFAAAEQEVYATDSGTYRLRFTLFTGGAGYALTAHTHFKATLGTSAGGSEAFEFTVDSGDTDATWNGGKDAYYAFDVNLQAGTTYYLRFSVTGGLNTSVARVRGASLQRVSNAVVDTPWTAAMLDALYIAPSSDLPLWDSVLGVGVNVGATADGVIVCHKDVPPWMVAINHRGEWKTEAITFTNVPAAWGPGNYPTCCGSFQGRHWFSGCPSDPGRVWATKSTAAFNFDLGTGLATEGIDFKFRVKQQVCFLHPQQKVLIAGTERGEFVMQGLGDGGALSTTKIQLDFNSAHGAAALAPLTIGEAGLFLSRDRRRVYRTEFSLEKQSWRAANLLFTAEHLTKSSKYIREMAWAKDPETTLALLLSDGTLVLGTIDAGAPPGWWTMDIGQGNLARAVCTTEGVRSRLWILSATGNLGFLQFGWDVEDRMLDFWAARQADGDGNVTAAHLAGKTVTVVREDGTRETKVGAGSTFSGFNDAEFLTLGIPYAAQATLLPPEAGGQRGSSQKTKRRWPSVVLRLNDSAVPTVNGERCQGTLTDPTSRVSEDVEANTLGVDDGHLHIEQTLPVRTEVTAVFGVLNASEV